MPDMPDEIFQSSEGFSTLAAQFTKKSVDKIVVLVRKLRRDGWTEKKILAQMQGDLQAYPKTAIRRLYDLASDKPVPDDVTPANLVSEKDVKPNTVDVTVKVAIPGIQKDGLFQHQGAVWLVLSADQKVYRLKKLV
jgi:hypothetical protein